MPKTFLVSSANIFNKISAFFSFVNSRKVEKKIFTIVKYSLIKSSESLEDTLVAEVESENVLGQCL